MTTDPWHLACGPARREVGMNQLLLGSCIAVAGALGAAAAGCNQASNKMPAGSASTAAAIVGSGAMYAPQGPFTRGKPDPARLPDPKKTGPLLRFTSPARGAQLTALTADVRVEVTDPDGVDSVTILGAPAAPAGPDRWSATVSLVQGLNVVTAEATDRLGNRSTAYLSLQGGLFKQDDELLERSVAVGLTKAGLDRVCDVASQQTAGLDLYPLLSKKPLVDTAVIKVNLLALTHAPLVFEADGATSGLKVVAHLDRANMQAEVNLVGVTLTRATITATRATATILATVDRSAPVIGSTTPSKRALGLRIDSIDVALTGFDVRASSSVIDALVQPFRRTIEGALTKALEDVLADTATKLLGTSMAGVDRPLLVKTPHLTAAGGQGQVELQLQVDQARGFAGAGLGILGGARGTAVVTTATPVGSTRLVAAPGARVAPVIGPEPFAVTIGEDAVNALMHALWRTGALQVSLDGTKPVPAAGAMRLAVKLLYPFLPPVRDLAPDPDTPVVLELSLGSAPTALMGRANKPAYAVSAGEAQVRLMIDYMDGQPPAVLFVLRGAAIFGADVAVDAGAIRITKLEAPVLRVDVIEEPTCDLADQEVEDFLHVMAPWLLDKFAGSLPGLPIPALPLGLNLGTPRLEVQPGTLTVRGSL